VGEDDKTRRDDPDSESLVYSPPPLSRPGKSINRSIQLNTFNATRRGYGGRKVAVTLRHREAASTVAGVAINDGGKITQGGDSTLRWGGRLDR
jgi:hypothetical protein